MKCIIPEYSSTRGMQDLGTLGGTLSEAWGINSQGLIVGDSSMSAGEVKPFIYQNGEMTDINLLIDPNLGWNLISARGINEAGQITGFGSEGGVEHAFLLTPGDIPVVPEPSTWALLAMGGAGLLALRRRLHCPL